MEDRVENTENKAENKIVPFASERNYSVNLFAFTTIERAWAFCVSLAESSIIPDTFQKNPASCLIALDMANRTKRNPLEVMQSMYVVHGKPGFSASFIIGLINSCGLFERLKFEFAGEEGTDTWGCRAWTVEKATGDKLVGPTVTMKMAKAEGWTKNPKWSTMPETMLRYRAASFFSRSYCPEITGGMHSVEELSDSGSTDEGTPVMQVQNPAQKAVTMQDIMNAQAPESLKQDQKNKASDVTVEVVANPGTNKEPANPAEDVMTNNPYKRGLLPLELMREDVKTLLSFDLDFTLKEQEDFLERITRERNIKKIPEAGLKAVIKAANDEIEKRNAEGR